MAALAPDACLRTCPKELGQKEEDYGLRDCGGVWGGGGRGGHASEAISRSIPLLIFGRPPIPACNVPEVEAEWAGGGVRGKKPNPGLITQPRQPPACSDLSVTYSAENQLTS